MQSISYHSYFDDKKFTVNACNRKSEKYPIMVNCAGITNIQWPFSTNNEKGREDYYLMYINKGFLNVNIAGQEYKVQQGTLLIFPPNTPYAYSNSNEEDELIYYWIHFTGSHVSSKLKEFKLTPLPLICDIPQASFAVEYQMQKIFDIYIRNGTYRNAELSHCIDAILLELAKFSLESDTDNKKLSKSLKYINNYYTSEIKIPELAEMEFLSVSRYITLFKNITGMPPNQYIINLRLNTACDMLTNSNLTVTQIANLVGFQNCFFFSKLFKKHMNISPLQYRKSNK